MSAASRTILPSTLVLFRLDEGRYALSLESVEHIVHAAEITPLANAPGIVLGVIDMAGVVLPVLDIRRRFGLPAREPRLSDHLIIARAGARLVSFMVDETQEVAEISPDEILNTSDIVPGLEYITGVVRLRNGLVLIHDLETFLSQEEAGSLDRAMKA